MLPNQYEIIELMNQINIKCAFCSNQSLDLVMDFGLNALAGGFLSKK